MNPSDPPAPPPWRFALRPSPDDAPLANRLSAAVLAAQVRGLDVAEVVITLDATGLDDNGDVEIRRWLKEVGRHHALRARWPEPEPLTEYPTGEM